MRWGLPVGYSCVRARELQLAGDLKNVLHRERVEIREAFFRGNDPRHAINIRGQIADIWRRSQSRGVNGLRKLGGVRDGGHVCVTGDEEIAGGIRTEERAKK